MIMLLVFFMLLISLSNSPSIIIMSIIGLSFSVSLFFLLKKMFFLFFIWNLVYIGGMMIVFTYVVFFSNYTSQKSNIFPLVFFTVGMLITKKYWTCFKMFSFLELGQPEIFIQFTILGELGWPFLLILFIGITLVLTLLLPILKSTTNQFLLSLS